MFCLCFVSLYFAFAGSAAFLPRPTPHFTLAGTPSIRLRSPWPKQSKADQAGADQAVFGKKSTRTLRINGESFVLVYMYHQQERQTYDHAIAYISNSTRFKFVNVGGGRGGGWVRGDGIIIMNWRYRQSGLFRQYVTRAATIIRHLLCDCFDDNLHCL